MQSRAHCPSYGRLLQAIIPTLALSGKPGRPPHRPLPGECYKGLVRASVVIVCKHEPSLASTLEAIGPPGTRTPASEIVVVDASEGSLDWARQRHPWVRWVDYKPPARNAVTIAHQRNVGVRTASGEVIAFTDSGCIPGEGWLERLLAPIIFEGEAMVAGPVWAEAPSVYPNGRRWAPEGAAYVQAAPTINLAFRRRVFDELGGFDESFGAGEDLDFTWRAVDAASKSAGPQGRLCATSGGAPQSSYGARSLMGEAGRAFCASTLAGYLRPCVRPQ